MPRVLLQKVIPMGYGPVLALEAYARRVNDKRTYELIKIRASWLNGCDYCLAMHERAARRAGESEARIAALRAEWRSQDLWSPAEAAALALTDEVTRLDDGVSEPVWQESLAQWGDKGTGHLLMAIATINVWNRLAIATDLRAEDL